MKFSVFINSDYFQNHRFDDEKLNGFQSSRNQVQKHGKENPQTPDLREELESQWDISGHNGESPYAVDRCGETAGNMRTQLRRIIFRAGLSEWERTF